MSGSTFNPYDLWGGTQGQGAWNPFENTVYTPTGNLAFGKDPTGAIQPGGALPTAYDSIKNWLGVDPKAAGDAAAGGSAGGGLSAGAVGALATIGNKLLDKAKGPDAKPAPAAPIHQGQGQGLAELLAQLQQRRQQMAQLGMIGQAGGVPAWGGSERGGGLLG